MLIFTHNFNFYIWKVNEEKDSQDLKQYKASLLLKTLEAKEKISQRSINITRKD